MADWANIEEDLINKILMQAHSPASFCLNDSGSELAGNNSKVYVEHNYVDHYNDPLFRPNDESSRRRGPRGGVLVPFPEKLYQMLDQIAADGLDDVVSFQPHGRCFVVHQPERFVNEVMPRYFSQTKLTSFQRQVNLYGFRRLTTGADRNGYYHELFLRGRPDLLKRMTRVRVKGIGCKLAPSPATEPNLYMFQTCYARKMETMTKEGGSLEDTLTTPTTTREDTAAMHMFDNQSNDSFMEFYVMAQNVSQCRSQMGQDNNNNCQSLYQQVATTGQNAMIPFTPKCSFASETTPALVRSISSRFPLMSTMPTVMPNEIDLTPLPTSGSCAGYLLDIQDDIISLLSDNNSSGNVIEPLAALSNRKILNDLANFWEV